LFWSGGQTSKVLKFMYSDNLMSGYSLYFMEAMFFRFSLSIKLAFVDDINLLEIQGKLAFQSILILLIPTNHEVMICPSQVRADKS